MRIPYSLLLALGTAGVVLLLMPLVMRLARRVGAIDEPGPRRVHSAAIPTMGGLAMAIAVLAVAWIARALPGPAGLLEARPLVGLTLASIPVLMLGMMDDTRGVSPGVKLAIQACAALVLSLFGYGIPLLTNPFGGTIASGWLNLPLTVLWVLAVINAINLIDGMDGLAAGVVLIASGTLWVLGRTHGDLYVMFTSSLLIGATLGFLRFNFPPARVFMGDTGSHFLGLALAAVSLLENRKGTATVTLLFPLVALSVPMADSAFTFLRRLKRGQPVFAADSAHVHHRLLQLGLGPRRTLYVLWSVSALCGALAILLATVPRTFAIVATAALALALFVGIHLAGDRRRGEPDARR